MKNGKQNNDASRPDGVLVVGNEVWAGDGDSTIKVIDLKTNKILAKIALKSGNPHSVAVNHVNGHVFVPQSSKGGGCGCVLVFAPE